MPITGCIVGVRVGADRGTGPDTPRPQVKASCLGAISVGQHCNHSAPHRNLYATVHQVA
jgi:hypothetical protein